MRRLFVSRCCLVLMLVLGACPAARAQNEGVPAVKRDPPSGKATPAPATPSGQSSTKDTDSQSRGGVTEVKPEIFYLRDKEGNLKLVPGFTFEDFEELYKLKKDLERAAEPARFGIDQVKLTGNVVGDSAELSAEVSVTTHADGWVQVPLGFAPALLTKPATYDGPSEHVIGFDAKTSGYLAWLRGVRGKRHVLKMSLVAPLAASGDQTEFKLQLPRTTLASEVELVVPGPRIVVETGEGATARATRTADDKGTRIVVAGPPGPLELRWQPARQGGAGNVRRLVADNTRVNAIVDGQGTRFDATIVVRAVDGPLESFDIQLPAGATLLPTSHTGYTLSSRAEGQVTIAVGRSRPTEEALTVRLVAERPRSNPLAAESLDFAGFAVVGAARQTGRIVVSAVGDWRIDWGQMRDVREIDPPAELTAAEREAVVASFEFFRQPYVLGATVSLQQPDISVDPHYTLTVERDRVSLDATLGYMIRGAKVSQLRVSAPGWEIVDVGPAGIVKSDADLKVHDGVLNIPLAQRQRAKVRLSLQARRAIGDAGGEINLELPRPLADVVSPATLVVQPADNTELTGKLARMPGMVEQPASASFAAASGPWQQPPLAYRQTTAEPVRYVAEHRIRSREVGVECLADVRLDATGATVEQTLNYQVAHEPLEGIRLEAPAGFAGREGLSFSVGSVAVTPKAMTSPNESLATNSAASIIELRLPKPQVGSFAVQIRHRLAWESGTATAERSIPLVLPVDGTMHKLEAKISTSPELEAAIEDAAWHRIASRDTHGGAEVLALSAKGRPDHLPITLRTHLKRTTVEFAWIQSWFSGDLRQDRVAWWVQTPQTSHRIALPPGVRVEDAELWIDGGATPVRAVGDGEILVDLATSKKSRGSPPAVARNYLVELMYRLDASPRSAGRTALDGPRWLGDSRTMRTVWQVVLPADEHVVIDPAGFTAEYNWGWYPVMYVGDWPILKYWGRRPRWEQADQERLTASSQADLLKAKTSRYSYSVLGSADHIEFHTAPRGLILFLASGCVLLVGLVLLLAAPSRRPAIIVALIVGLVGLTIYSPAWTILLAQAASLGLILVGLAALLRRFVIRRRTVWHGAAGSGVDRSSATHTVVRRESNSQVTTQTAPVELDAAMDVKP